MTARLHAQRWFAVKAICHSTIHPEHWALKTHAMHCCQDVQQSACPAHDLKHCTHRQHQMYFSPAKGTVGLDFFFLDCNGDAGCAWGCCRKVFAADCVSASSLSLAKSRAGGAWGAACVSAGSASVERSSTTGAEGLQQYRGVTHTICCNQGTRAELWMQARNSVQQLPMSQ